MMLQKITILVSLLLLCLMVEGQASCLVPSERFSVKIDMPHVVKEGAAGQSLEIMVEIVNKSSMPISFQSPSVNPYLWDFTIISKDKEAYHRIYRTDGFGYKKAQEIEIEGLGKRTVNVTIAVNDLEAKGGKKCTSGFYDVQLTLVGKSGITAWKSTSNTFRFLLE